MERLLLIVVGMPGVRAGGLDGPREGALHSTSHRSNLRGKLYSCLKSK